MAQKELGTMSKTTPSPAPEPVVTVASATSPSETDAGKSENKLTKDDKIPATARATGWGQLIWDKWRWGLLIAVAVLLSRLSTSPSS